VIVELGMRSSNDLGEGVTENVNQGTLRITSSIYSKTITVPGRDDLQILYWLIRFADETIRKVFPDMGYKPYVWLPGDVFSAYDAFRS